jgi:UDP-2,3-diacylglucosamine pyrophosphatase LpxH
MNSIFPVPRSTQILRRGWKVCFASLLVVSCCWSIAGRLAAHPPHDGHEHGGHEHGEEAGHEHEHEAKIGTALVLPQIDGPKPWSAKPALTDPNRFSIAIMTDRTGGHRPGIWMQAVERINWLRPDFVVSVGDLIEGYTEDDDEIAAQWTEFLGFIEQMEMKFFFVPGNHDVTNPKLHRIWREKFGREWYSFDYKGVHFVCLNSEDPSAHIGDEQLAWLKSDLSQNSAARWTLVFLHKPIWTYSERDQLAGNPDSTNWTKIAEMLGERPHTVFAGHVHHYVQYQRNGRDYYSLATTGGSSAMRGLPYGEFDHITWLTMEKDGPRVANLLLDGVQPASIVTEQSIERFRNFLQTVRIEIEPILISNDAIQTGEIRIGLRNNFDQAISVQGKIEGLPLVGLSMESQLLELTAEPGEALMKTVRFEMKGPVDLERFQATAMTAKISTREASPLRAELTVPVVIDREYELLRQTIEVDGQLAEWKPSWWTTEPQPRLTGATQNWTGVADCSYQLAARYDDQRLYFAAQVTDERVMPGDALTLVIDPRPQLTRLTANQLGRETLTLRVAAPTSSDWGDCELSDFRRRPISSARAVGRQTDRGYELEIAAPIDALLSAQGDDWSSLQLGARVTDIDTPGEPSVEVLWRAGENSRDSRPLAHLLRIP